jgi:HK97 family phage major capsid protein
MLSRDHETATAQARAHVKMAADLLGSAQRKGYESEGRFYMTAQEVADYDIGKAMRAVADPQRHGRDALLEMKISTRALKTGAARDGIGLFIPFAVLHRDLSVSTPSAGGSLVGTRSSNDPSTWLRPLSVCAAAGATFLTGLTSDLSLPRFASGAGAGIESDQGIRAASDASFNQVVLSPKRISAVSSYTRRISLMANNDVGAMISADIGAAIAEVLDVMAISGTGTSNQPTGILNTENIGGVSIGDNGGAVTWEKLCDLEFAVDTANASVGSLGYATTPKVKKQLRKTQQFAGSGSSIWGRNPMGDHIGGVPAFASNNVPDDLVKGSASDCSAVIFGNWSDLIIGVWGDGVEVVMDPYTQGTAGATRVIANMYIDVGVRRPGSFAAIRDAVA